MSEVVEVVWSLGRGACLSQWTVPESEPLVLFRALAHCNFNFPKSFGYVCVDLVWERWWLRRILVQRRPWSFWSPWKTYIYRILHCFPLPIYSKINQTWGAWDFPKLKKNSNAHCTWFPGFSGFSFSDMKNTMFKDVPISFLYFWHILVINTGSAGPDLVKKSEVPKNESKSIAIGLEPSISNLRIIKSHERIQKYI